MDQIGIFDYQDRLAEISKAGDPLELLKEKIDWAAFNPTLLLAKARERKSNAGRKPFPFLLMFKILILQSLYNLSDEQMEYQIKDRLSFMRFLDLGLCNAVPDQKTIWLYRETFSRAGILRKLFDKFDRMLAKEGLRAAQGTLIDATIVNAPVQRNRREENERIKKGGIPEEWKGDLPKLRQKDTDARWGSKHGTPTYGYKAHVGVDNKNKFIRSVEVTPANVHDSRVFESLVVDNTSKDVWADSGYASKRNSLPGDYRVHVCGKGVRGKPLSECQKRRNAGISRIRCRVEHVFGQLKGRMRLFVRTVGLARAEAKILLASLCYNMARRSRCA